MPENAKPEAESDAVLNAARDLLRSAHRPTRDSATAQVNGDALDRLRTAVADADQSSPPAGTDGGA